MNLQKYYKNTKKSYKLLEQKEKNSILAKNRG